MNLLKKHLLSVATPLALLTAGAAGLAYALRQLRHRSLPQIDGTLTLSGLQQPVEILRDTWGVPHIYARNEQDLFFAQGFVHAQDRLFQMDMGRRVGYGRLSEVIGPLGIAADRFARIFGWPRAARGLATAVDPTTQLLAEAYVAGVNAFIAQGKFPIEYTLLAFTPEPWRIEDIAAWGTILAWGLSANWQSELARAWLLETLGMEKTADFTLTYPEDYPTILPDSQVAPGLFNAMLDAYEQAMSYLPVEMPFGQNIGSNNWVVNGTRTTTERPILVNDPHLPPLTPPFWYENHLCGGPYHVTGFTMPGIPGVIIGHNEHIAWGVTNAFPDVQDLYLERFHPHDPTLYEVEGKWKKAEVVTDTIQVRGRKPVVVTVRYTRHGPIITDLIPGERRAIALRWIGHTPNNHLSTTFAVTQATDWASFNTALHQWGFPSQNIVYADVQGHIGYVMPGLVPVRGKGHGVVPVPGWTADYEWTGWLPFDELPRRFDPPEGFIVTANNRIVGAGYPHFLTAEWLTRYRADRILELLNQPGRLSLADHATIHCDALSGIARRFLPLVLPVISGDLIAERQIVLAETVKKQVLHGLAVLQRWDYCAQVESIAPSIFLAWLVHFIEAVVEQAVGTEMGKDILGTRFIEGLPGHPFHKVMDEVVLRWLEQGPPAWVGEIRPLLLPSFLNGIEALQQQFGRSPANWQWGRLHHVEFHHHASRVPGLGRLWKPLTVPSPGDGTSVSQADVSLHFPPYPVQMIASCRMILDVGGWDNSLAALPGGQSGHPGSPYYQDGIQDWQNGRYHPMLFTREKVETAVKHTLILSPETAAR